MKKQSVLRTGGKGNQPLPSVFSFCRGCRHERKRFKAYVLDCLACAIGVNSKWFPATTAKENNIKDINQ